MPSPPRSRPSARRNAPSSKKGRTSDAAKRRRLEEAAPEPADRRHPPTSIPSIDDARGAVEGRSRGAVTQLASPGLTSDERRAFRGRGHTLDPVVHIGAAGATLAIAVQTHEQLESHELVKVRVLESCPHTIEEIAYWLHRAVEADVAQILGRTLLVWRSRGVRPRDPGARR